MTKIPSMDKSVSELLRLLDNREFASAFEGIQRALSESGTSEDPRRTTLEIMMAECLAYMGRSGEAIALAGPHAEALRDGQEHQLYGRACIALAVAKYTLGDMGEAADHAETALFAFKRVDDYLGMVKALNWSGNVHFYLGEYSKAVNCHREARRMAAEAGLSRWQAAAGLNLTLCYILTGDLTLARATIDANWPVVVANGDRNALRRNLLVNGYLSIQERRLDAAREHLASAEASNTDQSPRRDWGAWCEYMAELELACGNLREAEAHLQSGIAFASEGSRDESVIGQSRRLLAEVRFAQGNWNEAMAEAERALLSIRKVGERFEEGIVNRVIGQASLRIGKPAEARAAFKRSIDILREIGARLEWAKSCLAAGCCQEFSRRERLAHLLEAERLFTEAGIECWITQTHAELKRVLQGREEEIRAQADDSDRSHYPLFVTADPVTTDTVRLAERLARTDIAILLTGETGVGKDQLSRLIHAASPRRDKRFLAIDLSTLPETLWESEVFGHRKGAFTGATSDKKGLLESVDGGTVFLNEIGNLPLAFQAKLLELLDSNCIRRIGDTEPKSLNIRFIAATNVNLREAVAQGNFRADLFYRLAQAPLHLKPLRERRGDIIPLLRHFLVEFGVPVSDLGLLDCQLWVERAYNGYWAGNVRQMRSFVHRLVAIADRPSDPEFPGWAERLLEQIDVIHEPNVGARVTRDALLGALERNVWNQRASARDLGITEGGVRHLMRRLGIQRPEAA